jgi:hypothetical protein
MDDDKNKNQDNEITPEEQKSEEEALSEVKEEEVKTKIAEDLGIDPEDEPELFEKLLKRELESRERLSGAIKQKINWRTKATNKPKDKPEDGTTPPGDNEPLTQENLDRLLDEREAKRDLENLNLSEDIETEIKDLAKVKGISVREAAKLPYIIGVIEEAEKAKRISSATPKRTSRGNYTSVNIDPSKPLDPSDFALDTKKGQKAWAEAKAAKRAHEAQQ